MEIDEVSERLGALKQGQEDLAEDFREHKADEVRWQEAVDIKLDLLISDRDQRLGISQAVEKKAKIWVAIITTLMISAFEAIKWMVTGSV